MLNVVMPSVVMLNAIILSVVAPSSMTKLAIKSRNLAPPIEILSVNLGLTPDQDEQK
jgi:hypothetical protein